IKGVLYPEYVSMPVDLNDEEIWVQVYVPVMESVSAGSGTQLARLQLDWDTLSQTSGTKTDKTALKDLINQAEQQKQGDASDIVYEVLTRAIDSAEAVNMNMNVDQKAVDATVIALQSAIDVMPKATAADKEKLAEKITEAEAIESTQYTEDTYNALEEAIKAAKDIYDSANATQEQVDERVIKLESALTNLVERPLDVKHLADGIYAVTGDMQKVDKVTPSMSNEAINHTLKLTVEDGKYTLSMDFKGLKISSQFGYLGALKYYKTGYSLDQYGNPIGELADVTVESYQTDEDGTLISDTFGTNYPDIISFEMISEAREDGYVPLQVFVPIMENISAGTGTQSVFLHLDWNSLKKATADDPGFTDTSTPGETEGSGNKTDTGIGNTLKSNSLGKSSSLSSGLSGSGSNLNKNTAAGKNAATGIPGQQGMATAATLCVTALAGAVGFIAKKRKELDSK
uniref:NEAT domain-containing protein n=1 Tax=Eubacterium maltosivorans TaxID=2041044 RepID=UPI003A90D2E8